MTKKRSNDILMDALVHAPGDEYMAELITDYARETNLYRRGLLISNMNDRLDVIGAQSGAKESTIDHNLVMSPEDQLKPVLWKDELEYREEKVEDDNDMIEYINRVEEKMKSLEKAQESTFLSELVLSLADRIHTLEKKDE